MYDNVKMAQCQQESRYLAGSQNSVKDRNPDSIPSRLDQASGNIESAVRSASTIRTKLFGAMPEPIANAAMNGNYVGEISVTAQIDILQARITELQGILGDIIKQF